MRQVDIILGTAQLTRPYGVLADTGQHRPSSRSRELLTLAQSLGFSALDTAPVYGAAEQEIGEARISLPVYTKLDPSLSVSNSLVRSLSRLRRDRVQGVFLHEALTLDFTQENTLAELEAHRNREINLIGASIYSVEEFHLANDHVSIDIIQLPYNALDRRFSPEFLDRFLNPGKKVFARSVFLQGLLISDLKVFPPGVENLQKWTAEIAEVARRHDRSALEATLHFALSHRRLDGVVLGAGFPGELDEIGKAIEATPNENLLTELRCLEWPLWPATDPRTWNNS
jgi:aryl-alcohol dehydrogenase-like predicted oxidoreductase